MPSKTPITPIRITPDLKERALKVLSRYPGETLNGWINMMLRHQVEKFEGKAFEDQVREAQARAKAVPKKKNR